MTFCRKKKKLLTIYIYESITTVSKWTLLVLNQILNDNTRRSFASQFILNEMLYRKWFETGQFSIYIYFFFLLKFKNLILARNKLQKKRERKKKNKWLLILSWALINKWKRFQVFFTAPSNKYTIHKTYIFFLSLSLCIYFMALLIYF